MDPQIDYTYIADLKRFCWDMIEICEDTQEALLRIEDQQRYAICEAIDSNDKAIDELNDMIGKLRDMMI